MDGWPRVLCVTCWREIPASRALFVEGLTVCSTACLPDLRVVYS